jgi:hypothetical protein
MAVTQKTPAQRARKALVLFVLEVAIGAWIGHALAVAFVYLRPNPWVLEYAFASVPVGWEVLRAEFARPLDEGGFRYELGGALLLFLAMPVGALMMLPTAILRVRAVLQASKPAPDKPISFADARQRRGRRSA